MPSLAKARLQGLNIALHDRKHVGVDHRGGGALVLPDLPQDSAGKAERQVGMFSPDQAGQSFLVLRIGVGVDQADGQRLDAGGADLVDHLLGLPAIQGMNDRAPRVHPFGDFPAQAPRDQVGRLVPVPVVELGHSDAPQLQHVPKPLGGNQGGAGSAALQQGVGGHRGPVDDFLDLARPRPGLLEEAGQAFQHRSAVIVGGGGNLSHQQGPAGRDAQRCR